MIELWVKRGNRDDNIHQIKLDKYGIIKKEKLSIRKHGVKAFVFWNLITAGRCCTYRLVSPDDTVIHESFVIHSCYKFPFLRNGDIEIGPCITDENWRGRGIYPAMLKVILHNEISGSNCAYMIIDSANDSSKKGVKKAGFIHKGILIKTKLLKRYLFY